MRCLAIDHVLLAMAPDRRDDVRRFYCDVLGFTESVTPANVTADGGLWLEQGDVRLHLGVEPGFRASAKAHPALVVDDLAEVLRRLDTAGHAAVIPSGLTPPQRCHATDPSGNRLEFMQAVSGGPAS